MATAKKTFTQIAPYEAVGIVAAQSIGEPGTQMSLPYGEKVIVKERGAVKIVEIGAFIDAKMKARGFVSEDGHEICDLREREEVYAPSFTADEKVEWKKVSALSRHRSPEKLVRITLRSGRRITATPFHSFVIRRNNAVVAVAASALKKGMRLPVVRNLWLAETLSRMDLQPALEAGIKHLTSSNGMLCAYSRQNSRPLPRNFAPDAESGWFTGIYLAEGHSGRSCLSISNANPAVQEKVRSFAHKRGIAMNEYENRMGFAPSRDLRLNSTLLSQFLEAETGRGSHAKKVPEFAYSAGDEFVSALLRGYFDGDGNVNVERKVIRLSSVSKGLLDGIALLLARFGIFATKRRDKKCCTLSISYRHANAFLEKIGSDIGEKRSALEKLAAIQSEIGYNAVDVIPGIGDALLSAARKTGLPSRMVKSCTRRDKIGRSTLVKYLNVFDSIASREGISMPELEPLRKAAEGDAVWDEISDIEEVASEHESVYDFTVPGTETFATFEGVITHNTMRTFHYAGVAEHVPTGLPRLIEIVDAKKEPKKPIMDIYLKSDFRSEEKAKDVSYNLESVSIGQVASVSDDLERKRLTVKFNEKDAKEMGITFRMLRDAVEKMSVFGIEVKEEDKRIVIAPRGKKGDEINLRQLRRLTNSIRHALIKGVPGVKRAVVVKEGGETFIRAGGSNILGVMSHSAVNPKKIYTNSIKQIESVLGIEAARNAILREIKQVLDMQKLYVDVRHIMLVSDALCVEGMVKSVGRHGLSGQKTGVFGRAAFEETIKHLVNASVKAEEDRLVGVTENIIVGQTVPMGTGKIRLVVSAPKKKHRKSE